MNGHNCEYLSLSLFKKRRRSALQVAAVTAVLLFGAVFAGPSNHSHLTEAKPKKLEIHLPAVLLGQLVTATHDWCWLVLIENDWLWLALIDIDWRWLILIGYDWHWVILIDSTWYWLILTDCDWKFWEMPESGTSCSTPIIGDPCPFDVHFLLWWFLLWMQTAKASAILKSFHWKPFFNLFACLSELGNYKSQHIYNVVLDLNT